jgi:hypothetical protein
MRARILIASAIGVLLPGALVLSGAADAATETWRYAITRNGDQIGTHSIEINRNGADTSVTIATSLTVKVLFVTAYRFEHAANEHWVNGKLVGMTSTTDNNGTMHKVSLAMKGTNLEIDADGKAARLDANIIPTSLWNVELVRRNAMLDAQEGAVLPLTVIDAGTDEVTVKNQPVKAHHYTLKSKFTQDVWYDDRQHLLQAKFLGSDGSVIMYKVQ